MPYKDQKKQREASRLGQVKKRADMKAQGFVLYCKWIKPEWREKLEKCFNRVKEK